MQRCVTSVSATQSSLQDNLPVEVCDKLFLGSLHAAFNGEALRQRSVSPPRELLALMKRYDVFRRKISHILNLSGMQPTFAGVSWFMFCLDGRPAFRVETLVCTEARSRFAVLYIPER